MSRSSRKSESSGYPEYAVKAEVIGRFFSPPLASSTFHDFVNKGKITPMKGIRGFYLLNDSLRRLGLREVPKLPEESPVRTPEKIIRLASHMMNSEVFGALSWWQHVEAIDATDLHHTKSIIAQPTDAVVQFPDDRTKHAYLQGVLDAAAMMAHKIVAE
jgi:hypothetical protein